MFAITHCLCNLLAQSGANPGALVERDKLKEVSKVINEGVGHDMPWELLMVGIGATLTAIVVISLRRRWIGRHENPGPLMMFNAIARKAGLSWQERFILWRIARANDLPTPIALLLARGALRHYAEQYARHHNITARAKFDARLNHIESNLFG